MAKPVNITPIRHRHNRAGVDTHIFILSSVPAGTMWTLRTVLVDYGGGGGREATRNGLKAPRESCGNAPKLDHGDHCAL